MSELEDRLQADAQHSAQLPDDLWSRIEGELDQAGPRDALTSLSTPMRRVVALAALALGGGLLFTFQSVRGDLDTEGWTAFGIASAMFIALGPLAVVLSLRSRTRPPLMPTGAAVGLAFTGLLLWALLGPWPGMTGLPMVVHAMCFAKTSLVVGLTTLVVALLERGRTPAPWRVGLAALGAGMVAFVLQGVLCPGAGLDHMVLGHAGAGLIGSGLAMGLAGVVRR